MMKSLSVASSSHRCRAKQQQHPSSAPSVIVSHLSSRRQNIPFKFVQPRIPFLLFSIEIINTTQLHYSVNPTQHHEKRPKPGDSLNLPLPSNRSMLYIDLLASTFGTRKNKGKQNRLAMKHLKYNALRTEHGTSRGLRITPKLLISKNGTQH